MIVFIIILICLLVFRLCCICEEDTNKALPLMYYELFIYALNLASIITFSICSGFFLLCGIAILYICSIIIYIANFAYLDEYYEIEFKIIPSLTKKL